MLAAAIASAREAGLLRAEHFLHLRCEIPMPSVVEEAKELIERPDVRLMSLMDHTPGQRQFRDEVKLRQYYRGKGGGMTDAELDVLFDRRLTYQKTYAAANTRDIVALAHRYDIIAVMAGNGKDDARDLPVLLAGLENGFDFVQELRKNKEWQDIPVVILTAKDLTLEDRQQLKGNVERVYQKGEYNRDQLLNEVRELVKNRVQPETPSKT